MAFIFNYMLRTFLIRYNANKFVRVSPLNVNCVKMNVQRRTMVFHSGDEEVENAVWTKTLEEVKSGWALGPLGLDQLPEGSALSRRFGLIDDLSASMVNATVQTNESPKPHTTDVVAALALEILKSQGPEVLGRAYDLKSAYKQLAISKDSRWAAFVVVFKPVDRRPEVFQLLAVPFEATRAVFWF